MPLGRAGVRHRLGELVLGRQRRGETQAVAAHAAETRSEVVSRRQGPRERRRSRPAVSWSKPRPGVTGTTPRGNVVRTRRTSTAALGFASVRPPPRRELLVSWTRWPSPPPNLSSRRCSTIPRPSPSSCRSRAARRRLFGQGHRGAGGAGAGAQAAGHVHRRHRRAGPAPPVRRGARQRHGRGRGRPRQADRGAPRRRRRADRARRRPRHPGRSRTPSIPASRRWR